MQHFKKNEPYKLQIMRHLYLKLLFCISILLLSSCTAYKKIPYLENATTLSDDQLKASATIYQAKIMPNDILRITVNSQTPGVAAAFNLPLLAQGSEDINISTYTSSSANNGIIQNYIVDKEGNITFPILGTISVNGLTRVQLENKLTDFIYPKYITEKPVVNVRFSNYKVSVLGEVTKPGVYTSENDVMTLFDALALAGDLTIYGKRENIMLLRENEKGELAVHTINLQDKNILLNKEIYYLQQNDKIIVSPNKTRGNSSGIGAVESLGLSAISILISVIAIITR